ncbi:hypothetical protein [Puniceibacterium sediminis]|uniref:Subtilase family protein n=1 Tax=Puniceibacterium sediminis TaxID=1608407 RepID=A0A238YTC7_9RHOB|nr:hypothetical protein [Puniceibacterium sediminis]SNR73914.1 hypothetical protein SAMN06265370_11982 [Puniceibacterium sediminis]
MVLTWSPPVSAEFWDAYLDWSWLLQERRAALSPPPVHTPDWFTPMFVRLKASGTPPSLEKTRKTILRHVRTPGDPLMMDPQEFRRLKARSRPNDPLQGLPDEYWLYLRRGTPPSDYGDLMELIDVGYPVNLDASGSHSWLDEEDEVETSKPEKSGKSRPIVAIIDDGIGFLNARFRKPTRNGKYRTRFHAVWLQALETRRRGPGPRRALIGEILSRKDINKWVRKGQELEESAVYTQLSQQLFGMNEPKSLVFGTSHGTHLLDLAAGANPEDGDDPVHRWPLIGVQLPPEAVADTSGMRFESYMVQAVRWILSEAARINKKAPVIINLSLGMLAGPKNGTSFAEYQIAREAALWEEVTGQPVRIVWAFGNNRRSRQVAQFDYDPGAGVIEHQITWRAQPDDLTASYMEIRTAAGVPSDQIEISLTSPSGAASGFVPLPTGAYRSLDVNGAPIARIYHVEKHSLSPTVEQVATHTLALAPNEAQVAGEPLAEAGTWSVAVRYTGTAPCAVHLQIQRDENLPGFHSGGRQSYFDGGEDAYVWDPEFRNWSGLAPDCPITRAATHSALVTDTGRQIFSAAAAMWEASTQSYIPAYYTPDGSDWTVPGPTVATRAEDGWVERGVLSSNTLTGSVSPVAGTSAAAGRLTRALAMNAKLVVQNAAAGGGTQMDDLVGGVVPLLPVPPGETNRLGAALVNVHMGARPRG